jgi:hypothetical protein
MLRQNREKLLDQRHYGPRLGFGGGYGGNITLAAQAKAPVYSTLATTSGSNITALSRFSIH